MLDEISLNNSDIYYQNKDLKDAPKMNDEIFNRALEYMKNKEIRKQELRAFSQPPDLSEYKYFVNELQFAISIQTALG